MSRAEGEPGARVAAWALGLALVLTPPAAGRVAADDAAAATGSTAVAEDGTLRPTRFLALPAVDGMGRRPFRPDRVFRDHLLDRDAAPPVAGAEVHGETGSGTWTLLEPEEPGVLAPPFRLGWATTTVEVLEGGYFLARARGATRLWVDGAPHFADRYGYGYGGVPVHLPAGEHRLWVQGLRGRGAVALEPRPEGLVPATWDALAADLVVGDEPYGLPPVDGDGVERAGGLDVTLELPVLNLSTTASGHSAAVLRVILPEVAAHEASAVRLRGAVPPVGPLASAPLRIEGDLGALRGKGRHVEALFAAGVTGLEAELYLGPGDPDERDPDGTLSLRLVGERDTRRVTFVSAIDGSLQEYGLVPPTGAEVPRPLGLVLSLHGAGVQALGQARVYAAKDDFAVVAPTNRRPFGFDWQDWGRTDAYEALADGLVRTGIDSQRVFVTGHSMGGHGTWHLAANDPDRFLALAPSAGWGSFDTYGGRPDGALADLWQRADGSSLTFDLIDNLAPQHAFVVHGTADDNVPMSEAEAMLAALAEVQGPDDPAPRTHWQEGAGHWWGGCLDWPGVFELFRERSAAFDPEAYRPEPHELSFTTTDPGVDHRHFWVQVLQARDPGQAVTVHGSWDAEARVLVVDAPEAAALRLEAPDRGRPVEWRVGDAAFAGAATKRTLWVVRDDRGRWVEGRPEAGHKAPDLPGNFKTAFDRGFALVHGTTGDDAMDRELYERARLDLENWSYRAGAEPELLSDVAWLAQLEAARAASDEPGAEGAGHLRSARVRSTLDSVILYGSRDTNAAWAAAAGDDAPVDVSAGGLRYGTTELEGDDLVALVLAPHAEHGFPVGFVGLTGVPAARLSAQVPYFVSGVGLPDWTVFDASILGTEEAGEDGTPVAVGGGDAGVLAAGWFANDWSFRAPAFAR